MTRSSGDLLQGRGGLLQGHGDLPHHPQGHGGRFSLLRNFPIDARATSTEPVTEARFYLFRYLDMTYHVYTALETSKINVIVSNTIIEINIDFVLIQELCGV